jgi:hypothetical protein
VRGVDVLAVHLPQGAALEQGLQVGADVTQDGVAGLVRLARLVGCRFAVEGWGAVVLGRIAMLKCSSTVATHGDRLPNHIATRPQTPSHNTALRCCVRTTTMLLTSKQQVLPRALRDTHHRVALVLKQLGEVGQQQGDVHLDLVGGGLRNSIGNVW